MELETMTQWTLGAATILVAIDKLSTFAEKIQAKRNGGTQIDYLHRIEMRLAELPAEIRRELQ